MDTRWPPSKTLRRPSLVKGPNADPFIYEPLGSLGFRGAMVGPVSGRQLVNVQRVSDADVAGPTSPVGPADVVACSGYLTGLDVDAL